MVPERKSDWKILVVGASGYFGKLLVGELLEQTDASLILGGRRKEPLDELISSLGFGAGVRLQSRQIDLTDPSSCQSAATTADIVICAAGPYQGMPLHLARACAMVGTHYIDIADDRKFVISARELANEVVPRGIICSGWSSMPSLSAVLARIASQSLTTVKEIHIQIAPGNKAPRSNATVESLLDSLSKRIKIWKNGSWHDATGWSEPRRFSFPPPVGVHQGYMVDVPDHELFPSLFGADTVQFRVGAELAPFNIGVSILAALAQAGVVKTWRPFTGFFQTCMSLTGWLGNDWGALGVEVIGVDASGSATTRRACIVADHAGQRIPVMPATIMCKKLIGQSQAYSGLIPLDLWIDRAELESECSMRGYRLIIEG